VKLRNAQAWRWMSAAFVNWNLGAEQMALWDRILSESFSPDELAAGAIHFARTSVFPPTLASWSSAAQVARMAHRHSAIEAWEEMYRNRHARYLGPVKWSSEAVLRAACAVRWDDPMWETEQLPTIRAQFERYYNSIADKQERTDAVQVSKRIAEQIKANTAQLYGPGYMDDAP